MISLPRYILGLLWADGNIDNIGNSIRLECVEDDIEIFYPIFQKTGNWNRYYRSRPDRKPTGIIRTSNKPMCNFLLSNNYEPHNIKTTTIIKKIPKELRHYWYRGLIDGDGCFYINIKNKCYQFTLSGSYNQNWTFIEILFSDLNIKYSIQQAIHGKNKYSAIRVTNKQDIIKLGNFIYKDYFKDKIGLNRKYNKYLEIKKYL